MERLTEAMACPAEIVVPLSTSLLVIIPVIGAMAGRLGVNREDIEKLTKMGVDK